MPRQYQPKTSQYTPVLYKSYLYSVYRIIFTFYLMHFTYTHCKCALIRNWCCNYLKLYPWILIMASPASWFHHTLRLSVSVSTDFLLAFGAFDKSAWRFFFRCLHFTSSPLKLLATKRYKMLTLIYCSQHMYVFTCVRQYIVSSLVLVQ